MRQVWDKPRLKLQAGVWHCYDQRVSMQIGAGDTPSEAWDSRLRLGCMF